jgi:hypothetical protein
VTARLWLQVWVSLWSFWAMWQPLLILPGLGESVVEMTLRPSGRCFSDLLSMGQLWWTLRACLRSDLFCF